MCGIIGIIGNQSVSPMILEGLKRLEYRGYDSAGIATVVEDGQGESNGLKRSRAQGKLVNLASRLDQQPLAGNIGIGHTRWATHGVPSEANAHPHMSEDIAVVHNGIIENFEELREEAQAKGFEFATQTDTEVIVYLLQDAYNQCQDPEASARAVFNRLEGAFALGIIFKNHPDVLIGARRGSPLAVGFGPEATDGSPQEMFLGSDAFSLSLWTNRICYLEEGDWVVIRPGSARIYDEHDQPANRDIKISQVSSALIGKGQYRHFMEKEIYEQPSVVAETLHAHINPVTKGIHFDNLDVDFAALKRITFIACGTSYYAGLTAKYWFEQIARLPVECDIASEYRYREAPIGEGEAALFISQSGETIDTLAALRYAKSNGAKILSIVNVPESSIARESDASLLTLAGPEIGVASTKAMTTQMVILATLAIQAGLARGTIDEDTAAALSKSLIELPARLQDALNSDTPYADLGRKLAEARDVLFLGRGSLFPVAMEGALKLKEISYIHAEGYAAGEMKHGPIALIDENVPIVVGAPSGGLFEKTLSNCEEAIARGGRCIFITDQAGAKRLENRAEDILVLPHVDAFVAPILYVLPMQLIAYHTAVAKGTDVDQPRNLAKSVTVE